MRFGTPLKFVYSRFSFFIQVDEDESGEIDLAEFVRFMVNEKQRRNKKSAEGNLSEPNFDEGSDQNSSKEQRANACSNALASRDENDQVNVLALNKESEDVCAAVDLCIKEHISESDQDLSEAERISSSEESSETFGHDESPIEPRTYVNILKPSWAKVLPEPI